MSVVTRFPPSPTGFMHIGNARTALFNYLYARAKGGKFLMRIEDTDRKRHSEEAVQAILDGLEWLGLEYDGEVTSQFARQDRHRQVAEEMLAKGQAYYCYCPPEELDEMRAAAKESGAKTFYDRRWREKSPEDAPEGVEPVVRIKAPLDGVTTIQDHVQGEVSVPNDQLDDFIILRSDGTPTYMLSVVVDDHDMGVTHIMRGDDHLNNTFRQKVIFDAMGWDVPEFAHLPMILGQDGSKFSKRHGAQGIHDLRDMGYLPDAVFNYLLRLGWSHGDDEIISRAQAVEWFDLDHIGKAAGKFDFAKLENLNAHYISESDIGYLLEHAAPFYKSRHDIVLDDVAVKRITEGQEELKSRAKTLLQFVDESVFYARSVPLTFDEKAQKLIDEGKDVLKLLLEGFENMDDLSEDLVKGLCKAVADEHMEGKLGKVAMPLRAAITGTTVSPSIFEACAILGKDECCIRLKAAI
mgnify:CR=1 FL=1